jgi:SagB-type dehydrogenase family enzyme
MNEKQQRHALGTISVKETNMENTARTVFGYHEATKHHFHRYARSLGFMDWGNQPDPFRNYVGAERFPLPLIREDPAAGHISLYRRILPPAPSNASTLGAFLELSMGLSAWKTTGGSRWSLRMNPSSGNLHPTEVHLVWSGTEDPAAGVYHYDPFNHMLEQRMALADGLVQAIRDSFHPDAFLVGISSIFWRESWKYGERAFRYCLLDAGHALATLSFSAGLLGWRVTALGGLSDSDIETILGFDRTVWPKSGKEHPELLCVVYPADVVVPLDLSPEVVAAFSEIPVVGSPNPLSGRSVNWEIIDAVAAAARKPKTTEATFRLPDRSFITAPPSAFSAAAVIRKRRSATAYDAGGEIDREVFLGILDKTLPRHAGAPFDLEASAPAVDLLLFVHGVRGLSPGLYCFIRTEDGLDGLRRAMRPGLRWSAVDNGFPLFLLRTGDYRDTARRVSCHQDIAGDGVCSLGMIAAFRSTVLGAPYQYRRLFRESGMIGQVLYLEAEAAGIRGTGIGCYFDDAVHELAGFSDDRYVSLYHFTMGAPVGDGRLESMPPYRHLSDV